MAKNIFSCELLPQMSSSFIKFSKLKTLHKKCRNNPRLSFHNLMFKLLLTSKKVHNVRFLKFCPDSLLPQVKKLENTSLITFFRNKINKTQSCMK